MSQHLSSRQRAILAEMGIRLWPQRPATHAPAAPPSGPPADKNTPRQVPSQTSGQTHAATLPPASAPVAPAIPPASPAPAVLSPRPAGIESMDWPALQNAVAECHACPLHARRKHTVFGVGDPNAQWMVVGEAPGEKEDLLGQPFVGPAGKLLDAMLAAIGLSRHAQDAQDAPVTATATASTSTNPGAGSDAGVGATSPMADHATGHRPSGNPANAPPNSPAAANGIPADSATSPLPPGGAPDAIAAAATANNAAAATSMRGVYIANVLKCRPPGNRNPQPDEVAQCEPYLRRQVALVKPRVILAMGRFAVQSLLQTTEPIGRLRGHVHRYQGLPVIVTYHPSYLLRSPADKAKAWQDLCLALAQVQDAPGQDTSA